MDRKARVIALYLPQYYPIKENDDFWGKGFTEWRNVAKARPLFKGHYQPRIPADLGFYDLRLSETRIEQAKMAENYGIEGFCYWHYWFGNGKMVLQSVLEEVLKSGEPDFPFCVGWANHSWSNKTWEKTGRFKTTVVFLNQTYPGNEDYINHFMYLLPFFKDPRYITVDGKPLFMIFNPYEIPDNKHLIELWNQLAVQNGLPGIYFVARCESATPKFSREEVIKGVETRKRFDYWIEQGYDAIYSVPVEALKIICQGDRRYRFENLTKRFHINTAVEKYDNRITFLIASQISVARYKAAFAPRFPQLYGVLLCGVRVNSGDSAGIHRSDIPFRTEANSEISRFIGKLRRKLGRKLLKKPVTIPFLVLHAAFALGKLSAVFRKHGKHRVAVAHHPAVIEYIDRANNHHKHQKDRQHRYGNEFMPQLPDHSTASNE